MKTGRLKTTGAARCLLVWAVAAAMTTAIGIGTAFAAAPKVSLGFYHPLAADSPANLLIFKPWAERVAKASGGRIDVQIHSSYASDDPKKLLAQLRDGAIDVAWMPLDAMPGEFPRAEAFGLPFVHVNHAVATNLAIVDLFDKYLAPDFPDLKVILLHVGPGNAIQMLRDPVRKAADLSAKRLAVVTKSAAWSAQTLGAIPVEVSYNELPRMLARKTVDGALIPFGGVPDVDLAALTKYQIEGEDHGRFGTSVYLLAMNKRKYEALPAELKAAIDKNSGEPMAIEAGWMLMRVDERALRLAREHGNPYIKISVDKMTKFETALHPVIERWIADVLNKGIDGRAIIDAARLAIAKHTN